MSTPASFTENALVKPLELYNLHDEKPRWLELGFDAKLSLYGKRGLRDFLAYLDSVLDQPNIGEATQEKYSAKRGEVTLALDNLQDERNDNQPEKEFTYPTDFNE